MFPVPVSLCITPRFDSSHRHRSDDLTFCCFYREARERQQRPMSHQPGPQPRPSSGAQGRPGGGQPAGNRICKLKKAMSSFSQTLQESSGFFLYSLSHKFCCTIAWFVTHALIFGRHLAVVSRHPHIGHIHKPIIHIHSIHK